MHKKTKIEKQNITWQMRASKKQENYNILIIE
jgi:hypothetical protein